MIWFALSSWTGLAANQAYDTGLTYNRNLDAAARQAALGWRPALARPGSARPAARSSWSSPTRPDEPVDRCRDRGPLRAADQRGAGFRRRRCGRPRPASTAAASRCRCAGPGTCTRRCAVATTCSCTSSGSCCPDHGHARSPRACAEPRASRRPPSTSCRSCAPSRSGGVNVLHLLVEGVHCGACVRKIERTLEREGDLLTGAGQPDHAPADAALAGRRPARQPAGPGGGRARLRRGAVRPGPAAGARRPLRARAAALRRRRRLRRQQRDAARGLGLGRPLLRHGGRHPRPSCTGSRR